MTGIPERGGLMNVNRKVLAYTIIFLMLPMFFQGAFADNTDLDKIKEPITKIYDMIKYLVSAIALVIITIAGLRFMASSDNIQSREASKSMLAFAIVGLVVIWVAPFVVNYLTVPA